MLRIRQFVAGVSLLFSSLCLAGVASREPPATPSAAVPVDAIKAITDAFQSHALVALGEGEHGNRQGHEFRLALLRDRRFNSVVNDVVVEFGNSLYQDVIDRFAVECADVPYEQLRKVWENTTQPFTTFDSPMYREFFEAVRSVNVSRPRGHRLRVLLGDPPIDWSKVTTKADVQNWLQYRDTNPVEVIRREVLAKGRRALLIYGDLHFQRKSLSRNYGDSDGMVKRLEESGLGVEVFTIWTNTSADLQKVQDVSHWPVPSLAMTKGTTIGAQDFTFYYRFDESRVRLENGSLVPIPREQWRTLSMENQFDAVLYLGPPSSITYIGLSPTLCDDAAYMKMRSERLMLVGLPMGVERLKNFCSAHNPK